MGKNVKYSVAKEKIYNLISGVFEKAYAIGYRYNDDSADFSLHNEIEYDVIMPTKDEWYADPFPFEYNNKHYIFVEIMKKDNNSRGIIGYTCLEDDNNTFHEAISEDFHLSYPNVFEFEGEIFMIPESNQAEEIRLYKNVVFPDKWELDSVLLDNICCADTSLMFTEEGVFCETYNQKLNKNQLFYLDITNRKMEKIDSTDSQFIDKRPGGNFIRYDKGVYHALQNCDRVYGEWLHIAKVELFNKNGLKEEEIRTIKIEDIKHNGKKAKFKRIHTFNRINDFEVIDFHIYRFGLK